MLSQNKIEAITERFCAPFMEKATSHSMFINSRVPLIKIVHNCEILFFPSCTHFTRRKRKSETRFNFRPCSFPFPSPLICIYILFLTTQVKWLSIATTNRERGVFPGSSPIKIRVPAESVKLLAQWKWLTNLCKFVLMIFFSARLSRAPESLFTFIFRWGE